MTTVSTDMKQQEQPPEEPARLQNVAATTRPSEPEHLPCPRCDSTNTKFCYYNNYNLSQPRHFCKSCRRYWTRGGTLRNVPVGGGSRKSSSTHKLSRPSATPATTTSSSSSTITSYGPSPAEPVLAKPESGYGSTLCGEVNLNEAATGDYESSVLKVQQQLQGGGFVPLGSFGFGFGFGLGLGTGFGTWDWPAEEGDGGGNVSDARVPAGCNSRQLGCVESGLSDGECYGWSDLAISPSGENLK